MMYTTPGLIRLGPGSAGADGGDWRLRRIQQVIASQTELSDLTLVHFSKQLGLSAGQLSRLFVAHTGHRFRSIATASRLLRASNLLRDTNMPIKQVAAELGYSHSCDLTHRFKLVFGVSPRNFRQRALIAQLPQAHTLDHLSNEANIKEQ